MKVLKGMCLFRFFLSRSLTSTCQLELIDRSIFYVDRFFSRFSFFLPLRRFISLRTSESTIERLLVRTPPPHTNLISRLDVSIT